MSSSDNSEEEYSVNDHSDHEVYDDEDKINKKQKKMDKLKKEALQYRENLEKRGVIYMSRVPPFMKPNKVRSLLEGYGEITRLFLAEEDANDRKKRKDHGGNSSKQFKEGWIEFSDKHVARQVAESLNNTSIGSKKGDYYHDDLWNLKYLKNFKWEFLTEKLAYERRIRETKMKTALIQSKKENAEIAQLIEKTKVEKIIDDRKRKRNIEQTGEENNGSDDRFQKKLQRKFRQTKAIATDYGEQTNKPNPKLLQSIFSSNK